MSFPTPKSLLVLLILFSTLACKKKEVAPAKGNGIPYTVSGRVTDSFGEGMAGVQIFYSATASTLTDNQGYWQIANLCGGQTLTAVASGYTFQPATIQVSAASENQNFVGTLVLTETEIQIFNWFESQQLANGLVLGAENGNTISLYDNSLAAMVFMLQDDFEKAEKIFDFFNARINSELNNGVGGFSQLRNANGMPNNHRWMGDNAWLLIALNNYKHRTGNNTYDYLAAQIRNWLITLQDTDGGLFAGYAANSSLLNYKVTEGNIDAFNAIDGYTTFHSDLLGFLALDRWDAVDKNLVAWPTNPPYLYALDLHPWSYSIFPDYPVSALTSAQRFLCTQNATNGGQITGYCFDEDKDVVWLEGTGQMATAFGLAGMSAQKALYLEEMEKLLTASTNHPNAAGFPYASNPGTTYGADPLWSAADTQIAPSGGAWYLFARFNFNPFAVGRNKDIPFGDRFWVE